MQEAPEPSSVFRERAQRLEAIDRDDPRPPLLDQRADPLGDGAEPAVAGHGRAEVLVEDRPADRGAIEEVERLGVAEDLLERLRDRGEVDRRAFLGRAGEHELLGEDRLSRARSPHDQVDAVQRQTAAEDFVEAFVAARAALVHYARLLLAVSDERAGSEQVLDGRDQFERVERLLQKGVGAGGQRLISGRKDRDGEHGSGLVLLQTPAQLHALTSGDHQLHDRELGPTLEPLLLGIIDGQRQVHVIPLGEQEELLKFRRHGIAFGQAARAAAFRRLGRPGSTAGLPHVRSASSRCASAAESPRDTSAAMKRSCST